MKVALVAVGKSRGPVAAAIADYERRLQRYFPFEAVEVKEHPVRRGGGAGGTMQDEGKRLLARVPAGYRLLALHREGEAWSSERLARFLAELGLRATPGAAFVIGGAFGLSKEVLDRADHLLSLSAFTLPHELARLVLTEQLYRAGTIARGEPYHKGPL